MVDNSKHDKIKNATGGMLDTGTAANISDLASYAPGVVGNAFEGAGVAFHTADEEKIICEGIDGLAQRLGTTPSQLLSESSTLREEQNLYSSGDIYTRRYGGFGVKMAGAGAGAWIGGVMGSPIPVVGNMAGAAVGSIIGGYGGGELGGFLFPEQMASTVQVGCDLCNKQDAGMVMPEDILRVATRKTSPSYQMHVEQQVANGNRNGFGLMQLETALAPLLGDDYYMSGDETACEYVARLCNERKIDAAQLIRDERYMQSVPPRDLDVQQTGAANMYASNDVGMDAGYDGEMAPPSLPPMPPRGRGPGMS